MMSSVGRAVIGAAAFSLIGASAALAARPDTRTMTCAQARATVRQSGPIVMATGANTFERFVPTAGACLREEQAVSAFAPTRDRRNCPIGLHCVPHLDILGREYF